MSKLWSALWQFEIYRNKETNTLGFEMGCGYIYAVLLILILILVLVV